MRDLLCQGAWKGNKVVLATTPMRNASTHKKTSFQCEDLTNLFDVAEVESSVWCLPGFLFVTPEPVTTRLKGGLALAGLKSRTSSYSLAS